MVQPTDGVSRETDQTILARFGGSKRIVSIPDGLPIIQRGKRATHFEVVPKKPILLDDYQELVKQIQTV